MTRKHRLLKLFGAIAVATSIAVVGARTAHASSFITDTLGGNGHAKIVPAPDVIDRYLTSHGPQVQGYNFITDTLGGNGHAYSRGAYAYGGASQAVAQSIQSLGKAPSPAPSVEASSTGGSGFDWGNAEIGAGSAAALLLGLLASGLVVRSNRRRVAAA